MTQAQVGGSGRRRPNSFIHFRAHDELREALDKAAERQGITRSEAARIILELYLLDGETSLVATHEAIGRVRATIKIAQRKAFDTFKETFLAELDETAAKISAANSMKALSANTSSRVRRERELAPERVLPAAVTPFDDDDEDIDEDTDEDEYEG